MKMTRAFKSLPFLLAFFIISSVYLLGLQQNRDVAPGGNATSPAQSGSETTQPQPSLPADRLQMIYRDNPEVVPAIESQIAERTGSEPTDEDVYARTQSDPLFRASVTRYLLANGYVSQDDPELTSRTENQSPADESGSMDRQSNYGASREDQSAPGAQNAPQTSQPSAGKNRSARGASNQDFKSQSSTVSPRGRRTSPYWDMPAMRDLYRQNSDRTESLERFGSEIFKNFAASSRTSTADVGAGRDYVLGSGDGVTIELWGPISRHITTKVDRDGRIFLPDAGAVTVAGKTVAEATELVQAVLQKQFVNIRSDVSLTRIRAIRVYVVGDVERPGAYDVSALSTVLNVITSAGGITARGSYRHIKQFSGNKEVAEIDLYDLLLNGVGSNMARLQPGDTVLVPTVTSQVAVSGQVRRPAIYELRDEKNLQQVIDLAGGLMVSASLKDVTVERVQANNGRTMIPVELPEGEVARAAALRSFAIQNGDQVRIGSIAPYSKESVYISGHVLNPGKYSFKPGMTVSDVIRSYGDLLPEPSNRAEIVRLSAPDFHPMVLDFNLADVLAGKEKVALQSFDTIRVYGRYEFDAPKVSIYGEVLRPGEYPLSENMTAVDLVRMAGGFKRGAFTDQADLVSYSSRDNGTVDVERQTIKIGQAMGGVQDTDFRLKPGDILTIRQITGWTDIGSSIKISGEVAHSGTYGIERGERLSSVLKRAGGFTSMAYTRGAVITRKQVKEIDQKARDRMIERIENSSPSYKGSNPAEAATLASAFQAQQQQMLKRLREQPVIGRQIIHISNDISKWENTPADIELRAGDELTIPKLPNFVAIEGQVNSPSAITFVPGKRAEWYLSRAGGVASFGDKKQVFVVRADGSVVGRSGSSMFKGSVTDTVMQPGDTIVVPEKIISGGSAWRNVMTAAQVMSSVAITAGVVASF